MSGTIIIRCEKCKFTYEMLTSYFLPDDAHHTVHFICRRCAPRCHICTEPKSDLKQYNDKLYCDSCIAKKLEDEE